LIYKFIAVLLLFQWLCDGAASIVDDKQATDCCILHYVGTGTGGVTYIRWGRRTCKDNGATLLYQGSYLHSL